jgi:hypothetical protein
MSLKSLSLLSHSKGQSFTHKHKQQHFHAENGFVLQKHSYHMRKRQKPALRSETDMLTMMLVMLLMMMVMVVLRAGS